MRRIVRSLFTQRRSSTPLTRSEREKVASDLGAMLQSSKPAHPRIRRLQGFFKSLSYEAEPPVPPKTNVTVMHQHIYEVSEDFAWAEADELSSEATNYLAAESLYADTVLGTQATLQNRLVEEFRRRAPEDVESDEITFAGRTFSLKKEAGDVLLCIKTQTSEEVALALSELESHLLLKNDEKAIAALKDGHFPILNIVPSPDSSFLALALDFPHYDYGVSLVIKDLRSKEFLPVLFSEVDTVCEFDHCSGFYYSRISRDSLHARAVFRADLSPPQQESDHILRLARAQVAKQSADESTLIYEEKDTKFAVDVSISTSGHYLFIRSTHQDTGATEVRFRATNKPQLDFLIVQEREEGLKYTVKHQGDIFYILSVTKEEPNGAIYKLTIPPVYRYEATDEVPATSKRSEVTAKFLGAELFTAPRPNAFIEWLETLRSHTVQVLTDTETSLQYLQVDNLHNGEQQLVTYDQFQGELQAANNKSYRVKILSQDYNSDEFSYFLSTLHSPDKLMRLNLVTRKNEVVRLSQYHPEIRIEDYASERIVLSANDGERIPVTLIYNKERIGKKNPVLLHTYGSAQLPDTHQFTFDYHKTSAMDRGVVWAIPHVRGSADVNPSWYSKGVGENKVRHFQDLLDVTVSLVSEGITENVCAFGEGPSGGLSIAAVLTKEPHLFSAVALKNPILDVPLYLAQRRSREEFGSMASKEAFDRVLAYSPYHQRIPDRDFSHLYISADFDQEYYVHAIKFVAKFREVSRKHGNQIVLREYQSWLSEDQKTAYELAFLLYNTVVKAKDT